MTDMKQPNRTVVTGKHKMTPSEAFIETLVAQGVTDVFGIVGSAYMDALDIFPAAGIRFIPVAHEQGAVHMADGYSRVSGRHGVCIAQNGPGITNFVTGVAAAYWAHSPVVVITPETGSMTHGPRRLPGDRAAADLLEDHQVPGPRDEPEAHGGDHRALLRPRAARDGPDATEHPARLFLRRARVRDPAADPHRPRRWRRSRARRGGRAAGERQVPGDRGRRRRHHSRRHGGGGALAELLHAPVANSYLHNDTLPGHRIRCGAARSAIRARRRR